MNFLRSIVDFVILTIGKIHWPSKSYISVSDQAKIKNMLIDNYFVILTYRKNHLSTFFVNLSTFVLTRKWGQWSHALMNIEDKVVFDQDFRLLDINKKLEMTARDRALIEATGAGVHVSPFDKVFDVHAAVLLSPKGMTLEEWRTLVDHTKKQIGKPYDTLFDIADSNRLSCVELVRTILMNLPDYEVRFKNFEDLIKKHKNLSPQMFYDCGDFSIAFEASSR